MFCLVFSYFIIFNYFFPACTRKRTRKGINMVSFCFSFWIFMYISSIVKLLFPRCFRQNHTTILTNITYIFKISFFINHIFPNQRLILSTFRTWHIPFPFAAMFILQFNAACSFVCWCACIDFFSVPKGCLPLSG